MRGTPPRWKLRPMQGTKKLTLLAGAAVLSAALALPADSHATSTSCQKTMAGPQGATGWSLALDGRIESPSFFKGGQIYDNDHGQLAVNGQGYPEQTPNSDECDLSDAGALTYPIEILDGLAVRRYVQSVDGGKLRHIEEIHNPGANQKDVTVDYGLRVDNTDRVLMTESGNASANDNDHWSVNDSAGTAFGFLQWGQGGAPAEANVMSYGADPDNWQADGPTMPDGNLKYTIKLPAQATIRFLHITGGAATQAAAESEAQDTAGPFENLSKSVASQIVNWGNDPDGDGVGKTKDDCPSVKGNSSNGCQLFVFNPGNGGDQPAPPAGDPAPAPVPAPAPAPVPRSTPPVPSASDRTAPKITLSGLGSTVKRSKLTGKGVNAKLKCNESCRFSVKVQVKRRGAKKAATVLSTKPSTSGALKLKVGKKALRRLGRQRITVLVTATDAAGNKQTLTKTVKLG
jgi:hypothetical protein